MGSFPDVSESAVLCCSTHSRDRSSFSSGFNFIRVPSSPVSILSALLLLHSQFYHSSFFSSVNFIGVPSAQVSESTVFCCSTHSKDRSSFCSGFNFIGAPSSPLSILSQFLLLQCKFYLSPSCSNCHRVQCSASPHIAETGVPSAPVSILLELLPPLSILSQSLLLQCQFYLSPSCSNCHRVQCSTVLHT